MKNTQWDSFQLFVQVARFGGLTGASASSGLSPATIGRRMLDLEHEIGKALFIRSQKGYSLTADGQDALAVRWFLTAAYLNPDSTWGQRAQLGAVRGLVATGDRATADAVYRRMEASTATDPDLLGRARAALAAGNTSR